MPKLSPLSQVSVRKLDWTAFSGKADTISGDVDDDWCNDERSSVDDGEAMP